MQTDTLYKYIIKPTAVLFFLIIILACVYRSLKQSKALREATITSESYPTHTYFKVEQNNLTEGRARKKMSVFLNAIRQTDNIKGILSITPLGAPEMIDGEPAYAAVIVTHIAQ
jgi:hypothetical protein